MAFEGGLDFVLDLGEGGGPATAEFSWFRSCFVLPLSVSDAVVDTLAGEGDGVALADADCEGLENPGGIRGFLFGVADGTTSERGTPLLVGPGLSPNDCGSGGDRPCGIFG